jgi:hypothetical protein
VHASKECTHSVRGSDQSADSTVPSIAVGRHGICIILAPAAADERNQLKTTARILMQAMDRVT